MKRRTWLIAAVTTFVMLAGASGVLASSVGESIVDTTAPEGSVALAPGASGQITINLTVKGDQDGTATFTVYRDWTLSGGVFTGRDPQTFSVPARKAQDPDTTFSIPGTVTVDPAQPSGAYTLTVGAFDITNSNTTGAKLGGGQKSSYTVTVESVSPQPADTTAPVTTATVSGAQGLNGWYTSDVQVTLSAADNEGGSGVKSTEYSIDGGATWLAYTSPFTVSAEGTTGLTFRSTDNAGNQETPSAQPLEIKIDKTAPQVALSLPGIGAYVLRSAQTASWSTTDGVSGIAGADSGSLVIDTGSVGAKTLTLPAGFASDQAGNQSAAVSAQYSVVYNFRGVLQPINNDGSSVFKLGSTVPVKFQLTDAAGAYVSDATATITVAKVSNGIVGTELEAVSTAAATTGNAFRYDTVAQQYIFNLATKPLSAGTWQLRIVLNDGTAKTVRISLR